MSSDGIPSLVKSGLNGKKIRETQPELFQHKENPVIGEIQTTDVNDLTPLEALNLINRWKKSLNKSKE